MIVFGTWRALPLIGLRVVGLWLVLCGLATGNASAAPAAPAKAGSPAAAPGTKVDRGFAYIHDEVRDVPWSIHVMKIDRSHRELELDTTMGYGSCVGLSVISQQVKSVPAERGKVIAAVNGDFYEHTRLYPGDPDGIQIVNRELISGPNPTRICFWVDAEGNPRRNQVAAQFKVTWPDKKTTEIGLNEYREVDGAVLFTRAVGPSTRTHAGVDLILERSGTGPWLPLQIGQTYTVRVARVNPAGNSPLGTNVMVLSLGPRLVSQLAKMEPGMLLQIATATTPDLAGAKTAIGGGPTLVEGGKPRDWEGPQARHPRVAVGWNKTHIFLVEVDGRQRSLSIGMTFPELAKYMLKLGCEEAVNLDGGGSATMWVLGNVMNSPSQGYERPAANALVLIQKAAK